MREQKVKNGTNLSLYEDWEEGELNRIVGTPRPNIQYGAESVKGTGLDEYGDDGLVHSVRCAERAHSVTEFPATQEESYDDHQREEDVERNGT